MNSYILLNSGGALGNNCGPLLVSKKKYSLSELNRLNIAIPGEFTTAHFLLTYCLPEAINKKVILFSEIEERVVNGEFDAGVIIHESRFTYKEKGLMKIIDLGEYWQKATGYPIPLGGIAVKRSISGEIRKQIDGFIKESVLYGLREVQNEVPKFVKHHAQSMNDEVMKNHIKLYVNDFSIDVGEKGKNAIKIMGETIGKKNVKNLFV